jgi:hypothetical protein
LGSSAREAAHLVALIEAFCCRSTGTGQPT